MNPEFRMFVGPMFGSKTTRLIAAVERLKIKGKKVAVFKTGLDDRYSKDELATHSGARLKTHIANTVQEMYEILAKEDYDVIAVDEAFLIKGVAKLLIEQYRKGKTILVASLDLMHKPKSFEETKEMLPWATHVEKWPAVCCFEGCDKDAYFTHKKIDTGKDIEIGGAELYEARCMQHQPKMNLFKE